MPFNSELPCTCKDMICRSGIKCLFSFTMTQNMYISSTAKHFLNLLLSALKFPRSLIFSICCARNTDWSRLRQGCCQETPASKCRNKIGDCKSYKTFKKGLSTLNFQNYNSLLPNCQRNGYTYYSLCFEVLLSLLSHILSLFHTCYVTH